MTKEVVIDYTNWKGQRRLRRILPQRIFYGSTEQHSQEQWLLEAEDVEKKELRMFALNSVHAWNPAATSTSSDLFNLLADMPCKP